MNDSALPYQLVVKFLSNEGYALPPVYLPLASRDLRLQSLGFKPEFIFMSNQ
jgi:hypothetical protein